MQIYIGPKTSLLRDTSILILHVTRVQKFLFGYFFHKMELVWVSSTVTSRVFCYDFERREVTPLQEPKEKGFEVIRTFTWILKHF